MVFIMQIENILLEAHDLAANAPQLAEGGDIKGAIHQVEVAREMAPFSFSVGMACANAIQDIASVMKAMRPARKSSHSEYATVQAWFKKHHGSLVPNSTIMAMESGRYMPDFMIEVAGKRYPVECKKVFKERSLNQLKAYMDHFGCDNGYAVANKLDIELPENITFIQCHATTPADTDVLCIGGAA